MGLLKMVSLTTGFGLALYGFYQIYKHFRKDDEEDQLNQEVPHIPQAEEAEDDSSSSGGSDDWPPTDFDQSEDDVIGNEGKGQNIEDEDIPQEIQDQSDMVYSRRNARRNAWSRHRRGCTGLRPHSKSSSSAIEVKISTQTVQKSCQNLNFDDIQIKEHTIKCLNTTDALNNIKDESILDAESQSSDLTAGSYEGGLKIWECTFDLSEYILNIDFKQKTVLDLGCGSGILGILAYKLGAESVHFQDYNVGVIEHFTVPNVHTNGFMSKSRFWAGDWTNFTDVDVPYDIILSSETIYNPDNYTKLHDVFEKKLKKNGQIFLAGKSYYFGVGGSMNQFQDIVNNKGIFNAKNVWSSISGVKREILEIMYKL